VNSAGRFVFLVILGTFFISGLAGLVYQVVWTRYLALFLGHTSYAVVAVLAAFMGGLALGNAWLGSVVDRVKRPLLFYAGLELGIGIFALAFPHYYELVHAGFLGVVRATQPTGAVRLALQFLFAAVTILLPTVLMGATLPALTKFITRSLAELRGKVAALYAINSSGAVAGTLLADWWWIPKLGLELTVYLGATLSLLIGLVALILSRTEGEATAEPAASVSDETFTPVELRLALIGIGVSGFVAMLYEVAWTRLLGLALGSSTHAYSLMLATFISGIAAGGWVICRWRTQANTLRAFALAELALALTLLASLWFYDLLPLWFNRLASWLARRPEAFALYELFQAAICFAVMFVPAMCLGMTLPLISRVATSEFARTGRSVGVVFAINTLGTVLGAVLTGLLFLPHLGLTGTFALGIALNLAIAAAILGRDWRGRRQVWWLVPAAALGLTVAAALVLEPRWQRTFAQGLWRSANPPATIRQHRTWVDALKLVYHRDGAGSTVAVIEAPEPDGSHQFLLRVNGKTDASSRGDLSTQILAGHIPLLHRPDSSDVLVVGLGSGVSVGSVLQHPTIKRVDVVEISPEVVEATRRHFSEANLHALDDPRVHLAVEDAKTFLQTTPQQFDVIITEPSNPWMAGVAAVFSREYYENCRARLKPGGFVAQWVQVYEMDDATLGLVVATFSTSFPHLGVWQTSNGDMLLIGTVDPVQPDLDALAKRFQEPKVAADLLRIGLKRVTALLALEHLPAGDGAFLPAPDTAAHSDYVPVLEYAAQRAFFARSTVRNLFEISEFQSPRPRTLLGRWLAREPVTPADLESIAACFTAYNFPQPPLVRSAMQRWLQLEPTNALPLHVLELLSRVAPAPDSEQVRLAQRPEFRLAADRGDLSLIRIQAHLLMTIYRAQRSALFQPPSDHLRRLLEALVNADPARRGLHELRLAELKWDRGDDDGFLELARQGFASARAGDGAAAFESDPRTPRLVIARMLELFGRRGDGATQRQVLQEAFAQRFVGEQSAYREPTLEFWAKKATAAALTAAGR
jgi:spermidine synthase